MKTRRRPIRSAARPPSSRKPPNAIAYAVITHWRFACEKFRSRPIDGSATFTIETSRIVMKKAVATTARTLQRWGSEAMARTSGEIRRRSRSNGRPSLGYSALAENLGSDPAWVRPQPFSCLDLPELAPFRVDVLHVVVRGVDRVLGAHLLLRHLSEHLRDHELAEHLAERRIGVAGMARVRGVFLRDRREDAVLAERLVLVLRHGLADLLERERPREAREVVELRGQERVLVVDLEVGEELLRPGLVLGELPDPPAAHHVLVAQPTAGTLRDRPDPQIVRKRKPLVLRRARRRDGVYVEVLLRLRVVLRLVRDPADLPDLALDLLHDLVVIDHVVLVLRTGRQVEEDVVSALRGHLCLGTCGQQRVEDVVDLHLDVVLLPPVRSPRVVEPGIERRDEVRPRDQRQIALEPAPLEPQRSVERLAEARAGGADRDRPGACTPKQLASVIPPFAMTRIVGTCHRPSFLRFS